MDAKIDWHSEAARLILRNKAFIEGKFVDAASGKTFECISPVDGSVLAHVAACDSEDVDRAVKAARGAFEKGVWADQAPKTRKRVLVKFADLIQKNANELALLETLDMGKPIINARQGDLRAVAECVRWYGEAIDKLYDEIAPTPKSALALITREPLGVVGAVVPWNFPLLMAAWKFAPALAAGNSVVLKPAEQSPLSALRIAESPRKRAYRRACSMSCQASARRPAKRSAVTWMSMRSPSPARRKSESCFSNIPASRT
jgi:gamma-glutamyl-gamma-aminobutyraldehyde dehydrogenase/4-guanidinobutyraldehyde dehydrogenase/NAD-dependent aldehyde dehydrogenase